MHRIYATTFLAFSLIGCTAKSEKECYEANQAVANAIDKSIASRNNADSGMKSTNEWAATHIAAMKWRSSACKD